MPRGAVETSLHLKSYRGRQGVSSIRETNVLDLGLVRTELCSEFDAGQNTSYRATIQAVFCVMFSKDLHSRIVRIKGPFRTETSAMEQKFE